MTFLQPWTEANKKEVEWWGDCVHTFDEEMKQQIFARHMGIEDAYLLQGSGWKWPPYDLQGKSVLDIGGGPVSLLLKCINIKDSFVLDPGQYPQWILDRYTAAGITYLAKPAEEVEFLNQTFDEVWIYNCLQHVIDPIAVASLAKRCGKVIRVAEWLDTGTDRLHLHNLTEGYLDDLFEVKGKVVELNWERYVPNIWVGVWPSQTAIEPPATKHRFHVLGLAHTITTREYMSCAYTQKVHKLVRMLHDAGHEVIHYGAPGADVPCEHVDVVSLETQKATYGDYDWKKSFFKHDPGDDAYREFNRRGAQEILKRKKRGDFLLVSFGNYQRPLTDVAAVDFTVEAGIGYTGVYTNYRVFESYAWMHYVYGLLKTADGPAYDAVIPNYYDPADFSVSTTQAWDYFLYMGRLISRKGLTVAADVAERLQTKLIVAGQGDLSEVGLKPGPYLEHIGTVDVNFRRELMANAKAVFVPTYYFEPFGGVSIEAAFSGTPVITSDWGCFTENIIHGVTGWRCRTMSDYLWAAQHVDQMDRQVIRRFAEQNFSMARVSRMYEHYFNAVSDIRGKGWYAVHPERDLDWLKRDYPLTTEPPE